MNCTEITAGFVGGACGALPAGGTKALVYLFNFDDIDRSASVIDEDGNITTLALKTGKKGVIFQTLDNGNEGGATFNKGTYIDTYDHSVTLRIFDDSKAAKKFVNTLGGARVVAIMQRNSKATDNELEVYGWESGLKMSENPYSTNFTDNVAYAPVLATDERSKETMLPRTYTGTLASLNALCQSAA